MTINSPDGADSSLNKLLLPPVSVWSSREPVILCLYHTPPKCQMAQLRKTLKPTLKIEKFVICTPHRACLQESDLVDVAEPRGITKSRSQSREHCMSIPTKKVYDNVAVIVRVVPKYLSKLSPDGGEGLSMSVNHGGGVGYMSPNLAHVRKKRV